MKGIVMDRRVFAPSVDINSPAFTAGDIIGLSEKNV